MIHSDFEFEFNGQKGRITAGNILRVMAMLESSAVTAMQVFFWQGDMLQARITSVARAVEILCAQAGVRGVKQDDLTGLMMSKRGQLAECLVLLANFMAMLIPPDSEPGEGNAQASAPASAAETTTPKG
jgi:hypothetical protein